MRNQNRQELRTSKIKPSEKFSNHKKLKKTEVLTKYSSLFHQRNDPKKELIYLNRQNFITSFNLKDLPKTLQAYYSVDDYSKTDNNSSCESILQQLSEDKVKKSNHNYSEDLFNKEKLKSKSRSSNKDSKGKNFHSVYMKNEEAPISNKDSSEDNKI